jgi:hypothetical protein
MINIFDVGEWGQVGRLHAQRPSNNTEASGVSVNLPPARKCTVESGLS